MIQRINPIILPNPDGLTVSVSQYVPSSEPETFICVLSTVLTGHTLCPCLSLRVVVRGLAVAVLMNRRTCLGNRQLRFCRWAPVT